VNERPSVVGALVLAVLATVTAAAHASDVTVSGAVRGKYLGNTDAGASAFDGRVDLDLTAGSITLGATYRAYQLSDPNYNPAGVGLPGAGLKHRYAEFDGTALRVRAGHFYSTFGLGLSLRSYEDVDLEYDTVLDGFLTEYDAGTVKITGLAGAATERLYGTRSREHVVRGFRTGFSIGDWANVAGSAVTRAETDQDDEVTLPPETARFEDRVLGAEAEARIGLARFAGQYADRSGENPVTEMDKLSGHATYLSSTLELGALTLLGEFKDYERFQHYLVSPPTCVREHIWTLMNRATYQPNLDDERGFLVEGSLPLGESLHLEGGASEARNHGGDLAYWEMFGQADRSVGDNGNVILAGNWSRQYELGKFTERLSGAGDVELTLSSGEVVSVSLEGQWTEEPSGKSLRDYLASFTFYPADDITFSTTVETSNNDAEEDAVWAMIDVVKALPEDVELRVSMGTERGGKKCAGGVCYFEPAFDGVRLKLSRFF
jgi:hypothetical protein